MSGAGGSNGAGPAAANRSRPRLSLPRIIGRTLLAVGTLMLFFLAFIFFQGNLTEERSQRRLQTELRQQFDIAQAQAAAEERDDPGGGTGDDELPEVGGVSTDGDNPFDQGGEDEEEPADPGARPAPGTPIGLIKVEEIGLTKVVVDGTSSSQLKEGPGHLRSSPYPGEPGNVVIAGRRTTYGAPFRELDQLDEGDEIETITPQGVFVYKVESNDVYASDVTEVLEASEDNRLTLVTSNPEYLARERLVVTAELEGKPLDPPERDAMSVSANELGLGIDKAPAAQILLWGELLVAAVVVTYLLYRRWNRWTTYLITTPILLALGWLLFESVDRLLPSTL